MMILKWWLCETSDPNLVLLNPSRKNFTYLRSTYLLTYIPASAALSSPPEESLQP